MSSHDRTMAATMDVFLATGLTSRRLAASTERGYRFHLTRLAEFVGHHRPVDEIGHVDIEAYVATLTHLRPASLRVVMSSIRSFFAWCVDRRLVYASPMDDIPLPRPSGVRYRALDGDTIARLLHVADHRERTMVLIGLHLGLRCCEMSRADVEDWDRHKAALDVRGKGGGGEVTRVLPVVGEIEWVLDMWIQDRPTGPLFPSQHSARLTAGSISQTVTRAARRAGVKATAHQLRHTAAHDLVAGGAELATVQRLLGHQSLQSTTRYLAANDQQLKAAMQRSYLGGGR